MPLYHHQLLFDRLYQQGVNAKEAPALLRDLSEFLESDLGIDLATSNSKLQLLGWNGVTLEYQSLHLALWCCMRFGTSLRP